MLDQIKLLLGLEGTTDKDALLTYLLDSTVTKMLNYLNREELPVDLEDVAVEITINRYRSQQADVDTSRTVKSVSVGGVRTEFADSKASTGMGQYIDAYHPQLNRFRRMRTMT